MGVLERGQTLPLAARAAKLIENRPYDRNATYPPLQNVWLWTCDECYDSGMTILVQQCPECQHFRCTNCAIYSQKGNDYEPYSPVTYQYEIFKKDNVPNVLPPQSSPKAPLSSTSTRYAYPLPKTDLSCH
jgi:hypothetical protein